MQHLVLIGGGHSHAIALRWWGQHRRSDIRLTLITDTLHAPYSGMLPGHLAGIYSFAQCHIDLQALAQFAGAALILDSAVGLDLANRQVCCRQQGPIGFDYLSIDIGSRPAAVDIPGVSKYALAAKPIPPFLAAWQRFIEQMQRQSGSISLGIVGGGAGGVELALTLQVQLQKLRRRDDLVDVHLVHRQARLMNHHPAAVGQRFEQILRERGVHLHLNESVVAIEPILPEKRRVGCRSGLPITCDQIIWVTQAAAPNWIQASGIATDDSGFIVVNAFLQSTSHPRIFAAGDVATSRATPWPKAGVFAVRQGRPLAQNLRRAVDGAPLQPFRSPEQHLALVGLGDGQAMALWGDICLGPSALFGRGKDWIDRRFMAQFTDRLR
jgi:selenide, water dikinase